MFSYMSTLFKYLFSKNSEEDDNEKEDFLAEQLLDLEIINETQNEYDNKTEAHEFPKNTVCFQKTGVITCINTSEIVIDDSLYFDAQSCTLDLKFNDQVLYLGYKNQNDSTVVVRILKNLGAFWDSGRDIEESEETVYGIIEHVVIGEVDERKNRYVYIKDSDIKFSLDDVASNLVPVSGDWLELKCSVQWNEEKPTDISPSQVLKVKSIRPLRSKIKNVIIDEWFGDYGICDKNIYFNRQSMQDGSVPQKGNNVMLEAIESNQGLCTWRATKVITIQVSELIEDVDNTHIDEENNSLIIEQEQQISVTHPIDFENINFNESKSMVITILNNSGQMHYINKWIVLNKKKNSQINLTPILTKPWRLYPQQKFTLTITCRPKFLGKTREHIKILFKGFQIDRYVNIQVVNDLFLNKNAPHKRKTVQESITKMKEIISENNNAFMPGVKPLKPPNFMAVRLGAFAIPSKVWAAVLGDSEQAAYSPDFDQIINRIISFLPCLLQPLNINNYTDRWHTLLYMEEIQQNINMRVYDLSKVFLIRCQEYLGVEIKELSEKRPSLMLGDKAIVKDIWDSNAPAYEGFIHIIKGDVVLMKFHQKFHESYTGSDVSIEFHFSRTMFRRAHQTINFAITKLGPDVLFPSRVSTHSCLLSQKRLSTIKWFKKNLNDYQKSAVLNILQGECRPLPYCIYGPPGTGKTVTVTELILQILTQFPDSRILVATPSNSAANLITEKVIEYREMFSDSILRLIAHHLVNSDNLPESIKPFCSTLDLSAENTKRRQIESGTNSRGTSFIGRHRVTIGTCYCLSGLIQLNLPKGHFTHIVVDEAGQATEPEVMIPLILADKESSQIILAGDPKQLGPVILSKYCKELGLDESYLSRILEMFPYQKDYDAYNLTDGFNPRLVTKLNHNYRSLQEVLQLPSAMFYEASLVAKLDRTSPWVTKLLKVVSEIFQTADSETGGIFMYGIRGCNARAEDSPSWYNPQEASMVALTVCKLYKKDVKPDDLGIITPYIAQIKCIRLLFDAMGLPQPKIGTVEEFQGQERPIILISTVRSSESHLQEDQKNSLGFVRSAKRLNVALTRAQVAVILFCDPHLLCVDPLWIQVINSTVQNDKYIGCDLPHIVKNNLRNK
ncbi:probable RNA helicase armi [Bombyx mori]|uniref:RNA helicase n=1 Tax=Bombyx mori TaxID=7091 RepID=A0A8R2QVC0_BOMMO|nr:probable RNA helicase armi [Bombyx mori]